MIFVSATQFQVYLYRGLTPVLQSAFELGEGPIIDYGPSSQRFVASSTPYP